MKVKIGQIWEAESKKHRYIIKIHAFKDNHIVAFEYDSKIPKLFHLNKDCLIELLEDVL